MEIHRIFNNNVVSVLDENDVEKIIMGRGLGFKKKPGDVVDESLIEKTFVFSQPSTSNKFLELVVDIPIEQITVAEDIINYAKVRLGKKLDELLVINLVDHIYSSITRFNEGITVKNALLWDIKRFYPDEFHIGLHGLKLIKEAFGVELPQDEAGFIALHLVNASLNSKGVDEVVEISKIMQQITNIVKYEFKIEFNEDSVYFYRFITHLKFFAQRLVEGKIYQDDVENELLDLIKVKYKNAYQCVQVITEFIEKTYDYELSSEEELYVTIHIQRAVYRDTH